MDYTDLQMQNYRTDKLLEKGVDITVSTAYFLGSFILTGAKLFDFGVPLSAGLAAACTGKELIFVCVGAVLGGFFRLEGLESVACAAPMAGMAAAVIALEKLRLRRRKGILAAVCGILHFACSTAIMFSQEPSLAGLLRNLCAALLCASSSVFYAGTADFIRRRQGLGMLDNYSLTCLVITLCTLLLGISEIGISGVYPARFFGSLIILCAAYLFGTSGGSTAGISIGTCVAVSGTGVALSLCYGISGLVCGIFSKYGRMACALVFSLTAGTAALLDSSGGGLAVFAESALAGFIFALIPGKHLKRIRSAVLSPKSRRISGEFAAAKQRMLGISKAVGSVSECVSNVSKGIEALAPAKDIVVCMRVKERVCDGCGLKDTFCPECGEFAEITKLLSEGKTVTAEDFSVNFNSKCPSVPRLAENFNKIYSGQSALNALQASAARNRELACSQFDWISSLLAELSDSLEGEAQNLHSKERTAARILGDLGFRVLSVNCIRPVSGALRVSCIVESIPAGTSLSFLTNALSSELGAELSPPEIRALKNATELKFIQKESVEINVALASASCGQKKLCGDYSEHFRTESKYYIILSDGMGTGGRAAIDSAMTVELIARLIKAGISPENALSITNCALSVKSDDESVSTLDIAEIDLFTGDTCIFKAGAAQSFYTCSGKVKTVEIPCAPLGILPKATFAKYTLKLRGGDRLILASDGIFGCGTSWIQSEIKAAEKASPSELAELILEQAQRKCGSSFDDMTVICADTKEI